jgi:hypothetical protein
MTLRIRGASANGWMVQYGDHDGAGDHQRPLVDVAEDLDERRGGDHRDPEQQMAGQVDVAVLSTRTTSRWIRKPGDDQRDAPPWLPRKSPSVLVACRRVESYGAADDRLEGDQATDEDVDADEEDDHADGGAQRARDGVLDQTGATSPKSAAAARRP